MVGAIIFDYGGVIAKEGTPRAFAEFYAPKFGVDSEQFKKFVLERWLKARVGKISSDNFYKSLADTLKTNKTRVKKDFIKFFGVRSEVLKLAKGLKKNYKVALLSNQIEGCLEDLIKKHGFKSIFDVIVTSYGSKIAKPNPTIFKETIRKLKVKPEECIMIDDLKKNISPAKKLGMKTILYTNFDQLKKKLAAQKVNMK